VVRERSDTVPAEPEALRSCEAGLAAHDAWPRPRQPEARRRQQAGGHPEQQTRHWVMGHTESGSRRTGGVTMRGTCAVLSVAQRAYVAHAPYWPMRLPA